MKTVALHSCGIECSKEQPLFEIDFFSHPNNQTQITKKTSNASANELPWTMSHRESVYNISAKSLSAFLSVNHLTWLTLECVSSRHHYPFGRSHPVLSDTHPYSHEVISYPFQVGSHRVMWWWYCPWEPLQEIKQHWIKGFNKHESQVISCLVNIRHVFQNLQSACFD